MNKISNIQSALNKAFRQIGKDLETGNYYSRKPIQKWTPLENYVYLWLSTIYEAQASYAIGILWAFEEYMQCLQDVSAKICRITNSDEILQNKSYQELINIYKAIKSKADNKSKSTESSTNINNNTILQK